MHRRRHILLTSLLVTAYLSTWSAALLQTIAFPAVGSGQEKISACRKPTQEKPRVAFTQRRHTPQVKSITLQAPPPSVVEYPRVNRWFGGTLPSDDDSLPSSPDSSTHTGRSPPTS